MENIEKLYEEIFTRVEEMCTSTDALAPYSITPVSDVTEVRYKSKKGVKESKMPEPRKAIVETMLELANLCEEITVKPVTPRKVKTGADFRQLVDEHNAMKAELQKQLEAEKNKTTLARIKDKAKNVVNLIQSKTKPVSQGSKKVIGLITNKLRAVKSGEGPVSEGRHASEIDRNLWKKMQRWTYGPDLKGRMARNAKLQQVYKGRLQNATDQAEKNILMGQIKRVENIAKRYTIPSRAARWNAMGKELQSKINRDPSKMQSRAQRKKQKFLRRLKRKRKLAEKRRQARQQQKSN